jgi:hypothetical protein
VGYRGWHRARLMNCTILTYFEDWRASESGRDNIWIFG